MSRPVSFWMAVLGLLLFPWTLSILGMLASGKRGQHGDTEKLREALRFARFFTGLSCTLPIVEMLLSLLPEGNLRAVGPSVMIFIPILGAFSGIAGAILSGISGRGVERWVAPTACLIAIALLVVMAFAGAATA